MCFLVVALKSELREQLYSRAESVWCRGICLLEVLRICDFPIVEIPLASYCTTRRTRNSSAYGNRIYALQAGKIGNMKASSTRKAQVRKVNSTRDKARTAKSSMSNAVNTLRLSQVDLTSSRLVVAQFAITEDFCDNLFASYGIDVAGVNDVIAENMVVLNSLRNAFAWYDGNFSKTIDEVHGFQPTMNKFIEHFIGSFCDKNIPLEISVVDGNRDPTLILSGSVYLRDQVIEKDLAGTTDLVMVSGTFESTFEQDCSNVRTIIEVKPCFSTNNGLYHSASDKPKDQMLLETECLFQTRNANWALTNTVDGMQVAESATELTPSSRPAKSCSTSASFPCTPAVMPFHSCKQGSEVCKGVLTDLFVICVDFRVETTDDKGLHLISQRVTDAKLYLKILLLSCLRLTGDCIQQALDDRLITLEISTNPEEDDDAEDEEDVDDGGDAVDDSGDGAGGAEDDIGGQGDADAMHGTDKTVDKENPKNSSNRTSKGRHDRTSANVWCLNSFDEEAAMLDRLDDIRRQSRLDNRKAGLRMLTASELNRLQL